MAFHFSFPFRRVGWLGFWILLMSTAYAQRELLPPSHPVYKFLLRQQMRGVLQDFRWGVLPLTRGDVARFLLTAQDRDDELSRVDQQKLIDFTAEFEYDMKRTLLRASPFLPAFSFSTLFDNRRQKYLAVYEDSVATLFVDGFGSVSYRTASGDSVGSPFIALGELGVRLRGTLFNRLGFYLQASNGQRLGGDPAFGRLDNRLKANTKFREAGKNFDFTTGYLQYDNDWLRLTLGREQLLWGTGYSDRMILSSTTVPFDFGKVELRYKSIIYSFVHGSLVGTDTLGRQYSSKYISTHRLEFSLSPRIRLGLSEAIFYSEQSVNFAYLNPLVFLTSADLAADPANRNNALIGIDLELLPTRNVRMIGTFLIDDLNFETLKYAGEDKRGNDNKFGWQWGLLWTDALRIANLSLYTEYTRINPFVYSHRSIANSYTHKDLPLGHPLQPNSDEWLFGFDFDLTYRLSLSGQIRFQRAGQNIVDFRGRMVYNVGGDILRGDGDMVNPHVFLDGRRVNHRLVTLGLEWQPIKQYFIEIKYFHRSFDFLKENRKLSDSILWTTVRVDY